MIAAGKQQDHQYLQHERSARKLNVQLIEKKQHRLRPLLRVGRSLSGRTSRRAV
jgi:hypothetical protein